MSRLFLSRFVSLTRVPLSSNLPTVPKFKPLLLSRQFASYGVVDDPKLDRKEVELRVIKSIASHDKVDPIKLKIETHLINDLGLDSLDQVEVIMAVEDEFDVDIDDIDSEKLFTVKDIVDFILTHPKPNKKQNPGHELNTTMNFGP